MSLLAVPSARAPFEDIVPNTQEFQRGYTNDTFPDNISASDDTFIALHATNTSLGIPGIGWHWRVIVWYNWTGINLTGTLWQLTVECVPTLLVSNLSIYVPTTNYPCDTSAPVVYNLTVDDFDGTNVSVRIQGTYAVCDDPADPTCPPPADYTWLLDHVIIRRVYTVTPPPGPPSPLLDWMLILLLLILWVSFTAIGAAKPSGLLFMGGALCGIVLGVFFVLPAAELPGLAVIGLAALCLLGGMGIAISPGGEAG
jgi:hypothetical protein